MPASHACSTCSASRPLLVYRRLLCSGRHVLGSRRPRSPPTAPHPPLHSPRPAEPGLSSLFALEESRAVTSVWGPLAPHLCSLGSSFRVRVWKHPDFCRGALPPALLLEEQQPGEGLMLTCVSGGARVLHLCLRPVPSLASPGTDSSPYLAVSQLVQHVGGEEVTVTLASSNPVTIPGFRLEGVFSGQLCSD